MDENPYKSPVKHVSPPVVSHRWPWIALGCFSSLVAGVFALIVVGCFFVELTPSVSAGPVFDTMAPWNEPTGGLMALLVLSVINSACWGATALGALTGRKRLAVIAVRLSLIAFLSVWFLSDAQKLGTRFIGDFSATHLGHHYR
jgi:hypothetical protein